MAKHIVLILFGTCMLAISFINMTRNGAGSIDSSDLQALRGAEGEQLPASSKDLRVFRFPILELGGEKWERHPGKDVSLCVVIRTFAGHQHALGAMLASLAAAAHPHTSVYLIDTGMKEPFTSLPAIVKEFNALVGFEMAKVSNRTSNNSRPLIRALQGFEDWGYAATDMVINDLLQLNAAANKAGQPKPCMALYFTNGDNLIAKSFFVETLDAMARGHNIVATNYIEYKHQRVKKGLNLQPFCGAWRSGKDVEMNPKFKVACVDLAAVVTNATLWERGARGVRFIANALTDGVPVAGRATRRHEWRIYAADGYAYQELAALKDENPAFVR
jgi:hypothetical protein